MIKSKPLPIYQIINNCRDQRLHGPNCRDDTHIESAHVREKHSHEHRAHYPKKEAAHYNENQEVPAIQFSTDNDIVAMPNVFTGWIPVVPYRHGNLKSNSCNPATET